MISITGIEIVRDINGCKNIFKIFKCTLETKNTT